MGLLEGKGTEGDTFGEGIGSVTGIVSGGSIVFFFWHRGGWSSYRLIAGCSRLTTRSRRGAGNSGWLWGRFSRWLDRRGSFNNHSVIIFWRRRVWQKRNSFRGRTTIMLWSGHNLGIPARCPCRRPGPLLHNLCLFWWRPHKSCTYTSKGIRQTRWGGVGITFYSRNFKNVEEKGQRRRYPNHISRSGRN